MNFKIWDLSLATAQTALRFQAEKTEGEMVADWENKQREHVIELAQQLLAIWSKLKVTTPFCCLSAVKIIKFNIPTKVYN